MGSILFLPNYMNRKRILIGILMFILLILSGTIFYGWWLSEEREIIITTDRREYQIGEPVKIIFKSDPSRPIYYAEGWWSGGCPDSKLPGCELVKIGSGGFYTFGSSECVTKVGKYIKINPKQEFSVEWNQVLYGDSTSGLPLRQAEEGVYKIECKYATHKYNCLLFPGMEWYCLFRNPFFKYSTFSSPEFIIKSNR